MITFVTRLEISLGRWSGHAGRWRPGGRWGPVATEAKCIPLQAPHGFATVRPAGNLPKIPKSPKLAGGVDAERCSPPKLHLSPPALFRTPLDNPSPPKTPPTPTKWPPSRRASPPRLPRTSTRSSSSLSSPARCARTVLWGGQALTAVHARIQAGAQAAPIGQGWVF